MDFDQPDWAAEQRSSVSTIERHHGWQQVIWVTSSYNGEDGVSCQLTNLPGCGDIAEDIRDAFGLKPTRFNGVVRALIQTVAEDREVVIGRFQVFLPVQV